MYVAVSLECENKFVTMFPASSLKSTNLIPVAEGKFRIVYVFDIYVGSLCPSTTHEITESFISGSHFIEFNSGR